MSQVSSPATFEQPTPVMNDNSRPITPLVLKDLLEREEKCRVNYGQPLMSNDGRDNLVDAYQEVLDLCLYLRKAITERETAIQTPLGYPSPLPYWIMHYDHNPNEHGGDHIYGGLNDDNLIAFWNTGGIEKQNRFLGISYANHYKGDRIYWDYLQGTLITEVNYNRRKEKGTYGYV